MMIGKVELYSKKSQSCVRALYVTPDLFNSAKSLVISKRSPHILFYTRNRVKTAPDILKTSHTVHHRRAYDKKCRKKVRRLNLYVRVL